MPDAHTHSEVQAALSSLASYFLADLPPEAELTAGLITEACQTLKRNRQRYLEERSTDSIVRLLDRLGRDWLEADFPFRKMALEAGPEATGFSAPILASGLNAFFKQLTSANLEALLHQELGQARRLDSFFAGDHEPDPRRTALARGPELLAHIAPGNLPTPVLMQMVLGLLARSAQFVKCASNTAFVPRLFAHSIYQADRKLGACMEIAQWRGGDQLLEPALFAESDCVVATGSDEMLAALRPEVPAGARFLGYGTRVSLGYVTREAFEEESEDVAKWAAADVTAWDQLGCLSPHVIYIEDSGGAGEFFASMLAEELEAREKTHPRGALTAQEAADIARRRSFYEVRAAHSPETRLWASSASTAWTVVLENDPLFQLSCLNRFIYVKAVASLTHALQGLETVRERISTVGLASTERQAPELARQFARWGAKRVCPLGRMQQPPLGWRHDGRPPLGDLLTWCDWEK
ncbi:MAG: acyl-CoA reductase [Limisphaerales bacterium]